MLCSKRRSPLVVSTLLTTLALLPQNAWAQDFETGALIIPMDTDYQDDGMFLAFGLVYQLLLNDVHVSWVIKADKNLGDTDFTASATDLQSSDPVTSHDYTGGPWVIDAADAAAAMPVITAWQTTHPDTKVHVATAPFSGDVAHRLVAAPTIAMVADGNEDIARKYMEAAQIPDSVGDLTWPDDSPDMLDIDELQGPTTEIHNDGALFDEEGAPIYCQLMSMHWGVNDAEDNPEVVAEVRQYLTYPTHFFAECQAVNAFENTLPYGLFLTDMGFEIGDGPNAYDYYNQDTPYAQHDAVFEGVGGSEPAYSLPPGGSYLGTDVVMITEQGTPIGVNDVWMTGFVDGLCPESQLHYQNSYASEYVGPPAPSGACLTTGKVSYLGGHEYKTDLPMSQNPDSVGARLFLNSLFEAPCATEEGEPQIELEKGGPATTAVPEITYTIDFTNIEGVTAQDAMLFDTLPAGTSFVSASDGGTLNGNTVEWDLGNIGQWEGGSVELTITLPEYGGYDNFATLTYQVGLNDRTLDSNVFHTEYSENGGDGDGDGDGGDGDAGDSGATDGSGDTGTSADGSGTGGSGTGEDGGADASEGDETASETGDADAGAADAGSGGCSCSTEGDDRGLPLLFMGIAFVGLRRRRAVDALS